MNLTVATIAFVRGMAFGSAPAIVVAFRGSRSLGAEANVVEIGTRPVMTLWLRSRQAD
jgi:uncharacterized membrane protein SpoIIM required for sporulation